MRIEVATIFTTPHRVHTITTWCTRFQSARVPKQTHSHERNEIRCYLCSASALCAAFGHRITPINCRPMKSVSYCGVLASCAKLHMGRTPFRGSHTISAKFVCRRMFCVRAKPKSLICKALAAPLWDNGGSTAYNMIDVLFELNRFTACTHRTTHTYTHNYVPTININCLMSIMPFCLQVRIQIRLSILHGATHEDVLARPS